MGKKIRKILKWTLLAFLSLAILLLAITCIQKRIVSGQLERSTAIGPDGISENEEVMLGGDSQWIFIRGEKKTNPVVLYIHGGPGSPHSFAARALDLELEKDFTVVNWDQRGAGKSFSLSVSPESLNKDQYLSDTYELIQYLKKKLNTPKIYIMGHSWGSWLGAVTSHRHPEDVIAFIGIGQMVNAEENETVSYDFTLESARRDYNQEAVRALEEIGRPPYSELRSLGVERKWLQKYGGAMFYGEHRDDAYAFIGKMMFASPDYSYLDMFKFFAGVVRTLYYIFPQFFSLDLYTQAPEIKVPVYFMTGRHDYNTPWPLVLKYEKILKAPRKTVIWFENSAHAPNFEEPQAFAEAMRRVKRETWK